jgi:hypothetical protein
MRAAEVGQISGEGIILAQTRSADFQRHQRDDECGLGN